MGIVTALQGILTMLGTSWPTQNELDGIFVDFFFVSDCFVWFIDLLRVYFGFRFYGFFCGVCICKFTVFCLLFFKEREREWWRGSGRSWGRERTDQNILYDNIFFSTKNKQDLSRPAGSYAS